MRVVRNERSWVIDMISTINIFLQNKTLKIKRVSGESTINTGEKTMFPDVLLYEDQSQKTILQGWEVKLPDVRITDEEFIKDAQRKANTLGLTTCFIWNFTSAVLYVKDNRGDFQIEKQWNETSHIRTREDVETYREDWESLLKSIIIELNDYFLHNEFRSSRIETIIAENLLESIIQNNKELVADHLEAESNTNRTLKSFLNVWWREMSVEFLSDERDMYNAYAKSILMNWINKITFAHTIKRYHSPAYRVEDLDFEVTPSEGSQLFEEISRLCDFYNIFKTVDYADVLPDYSWEELIEFNLFLVENNISEFEQSVVQRMLEQNIKTVKREIAGQFGTPKLLADFLANITVENLRAETLDCCSGTGTIPRAVLDLKKEGLSLEEAYKTTWASDKFAFPLQVSNLNLTDVDSINIPARIFQKNVFDLEVGSTIEITDPADGSVLELEVPKFDVILSNLPFVKFSNIGDDEKEHLLNVAESIQGSLDLRISNRSDLYAYIAIKLWDILKDDGRVGIIISNAWLGTIAGREFYETIKRLFELENVIISGKKRWFQNAKVVTTILILNKKEQDVFTEYDTYFTRLNVELSELDDPEKMETISDSIMLKENQNENLLSMTSYSQKKISELLEMNISLNSLFGDVDWLLDIKDKLTLATDYFDIIRGERRGWDTMFYPEDGHLIEKEYIKRVLKSPVNLQTLYADTDRDAFCCSKTIEELEELGHSGAINWIRKFESENNNTGVPLVKSLRRANMHWYEMSDKSTADFITAINPDRRLFFSRFEHPSFINQRLIGFSVKDREVDFDILHAILNSMLGMFYIQAVGFGRGLGALDINKGNLEKFYMLDPALLTENQKLEIKNAFNSLLGRNVKSTVDELEDEGREEFDRIVLRAFGIENKYENIKESILRMQQLRLTANER